MHPKIEFFYSNFINVWVFFLLKKSKLDDISCIYQVNQQYTMLAVNTTLRNFKPSEEFSKKMSGKELFKNTTRFHVT